MPEQPCPHGKKTQAICSAEFNYTEKCQTPIPCFWSPSSHLASTSDPTFSCWGFLFCGVEQLPEKSQWDWTKPTGHWSFLAFPLGKLVGHKEMTLLICLWLQLYNQKMYELLYIILSFTNNKSKCGWLKDYHREITQYRQYLPNLLSPVTCAHENKERNKCVRFHSVWLKFSFEDPFPRLSDPTFSKIESCN